MTAAARRIAVTRDEEAGGPLAAALRAHGLAPVACPVLRHEAPGDPAPLRAAAAALERFDWLVVASARAVQALLAARGGAPLPSALRTAAVGAATAAALRAAGGGAPLVAPQSGAAALARALRDADAWPERTVLLPRAAGGGTELGEALRAAGARVVEPIAYRTLARDPAGIARAWRALAPEGVVLASPSAARALAAGIGVATLRALPVVVALGPTTAAALAALGVQPRLAAHADFAAAAAAARDAFPPSPATPTGPAPARAAQEHRP